MGWSRRVWTLVILISACWNVVINGRPDVSSLNQEKKIDEFVFLLPAGADGNNLYSQLTSGNGKVPFAFDLVPPHPVKTDSYGNPIPDDNTKPANGIKFQIPSYASGISGIREPSDDLLPPLDSTEVNDSPTSTVPAYNQATDALPTLSNRNDNNARDDESLNEIPGPTLPSTIPQTEVTPTIPQTEVAATISQTEVATDFPAVKYTGGFGGASGFLGEQKEVGYWVKAKQEAEAAKKEPTKPEVPEKETTFAPPAVTTNVNVVPIPATDLVVPSSPPQGEYTTQSNVLHYQPSDAPTQTYQPPVDFPVRGSFPQTDLPVRGSFPQTDFSDRGSFPQTDLPVRGSFPQTDLPVRGSFPQTDFSDRGSFPQTDLPVRGSFPQTDLPVRGSFPQNNIPVATPGKGKYTGGFGGAPGVLGDQHKPGFAIQPDGSIVDPDHTYRPPSHVHPPPTQAPLPVAPLIAPVKHEKYTGGFGGPPGVLEPSHNG